MPHPASGVRLRRLHRKAKALRAEVLRLRRQRHLAAAYPPIEISAEDIRRYYESSRGYDVLSRWDSGAGG